MPSSTHREYLEAMRGAKAMRSESPYLLTRIEEEHHVSPFDTRRKAYHSRSFANGKGVPVPLYQSMRLDAYSNHSASLTPTNDSTCTSSDGNSLGPETSSPPVNSSSKSENGAKGGRYMQRESKAKLPVRFAEDSETGRLSLQIRESQGPLSEEEKQAIWWSSVDFRAIRHACKSEAFRASSTPGLPSRICSVFDACLSGNLYNRYGGNHTSSNDLSLCSSHETRTAPELISSSRSMMMPSMGLEDCIRIVSSTGVRGLEEMAFPPLKQHRRSVVQRLIMTQSRLSRSMSLSEREVILASKSRLLSRPFRQLARLMGSGDEFATKMPMEEQEDSCQQAPIVNCEC